MALGWLWWRAWAGVNGVDAAGSLLCVAGVALMALGWLWWRAWAGVDGVDTAAFCVALGDMDLHCVAGVALGDMDLHFAWQAWRLVTWIVHFAWQAWHLWHWAGSGGTLGSQLRHNLSTHHLLTHNLLTQLCHIQLFHTQHFYIHKLTHTHTHNTVAHSSFTQPVLHHLLSFLPFPSHFHICLVIIGRS